MAGTVCIHLIALMYSSCCGWRRERLDNVSEDENRKGNIMIYHSFLTMEPPQVSCLFVRGMLDPIDAKVKVKTRAVKLAFIFAGFGGFNNYSKFWSGTPVLYMRDFQGTTARW